MTGRNLLVSGLAVSLLFAIPSPGASEISIRGPRLGFVYEPGSGSLRPIRGLPGAATLGPPLELEARIARAWISPRQDYALAVRAEDAAVLVLRLDSDAVSLQPAGGITPGPDLAALSPGGRSAALYYRERGRVEWITGLPGETAIAGSVDLMPGGTVTALAISEDAGALLLGISDDSGGSVSLVQPGGEPRFLFNLSRAAAIAWLGESRDALIADDLENRVYVIRDATGAAVALQAAGPDEGITRPVAIAASHDGRLVFVANSEPGTLTVLDLSEAGVSAFPCECAPTSLERLAGASVFRLTEPSQNPMWLFDGDSSPPRLVFVPAAVPAALTEEAP